MHVFITSLEWNIHTDSMSSRESLLNIELKITPYCRVCSQAKRVRASPYFSVHTGESFVIRVCTQARGKYTYLFL